MSNKFVLAQFQPDLTPIRTNEIGPEAEETTGMHSGACSLVYNSSADLVYLAWAQSSDHHLMTAGAVRTTGAVSWTADKGIYHDGTGQHLIRCGLAVDGVTKYGYLVFAVEKTVSVAWPATLYSRFDEAGTGTANTVTWWIDCVSRPFVFGGRCYFVGTGSDMHRTDPSSRLQGHGYLLCVERNDGVSEPCRVVCRVFPYTVGALGYSCVSNALASEKYGWASLIPRMSDYSVDSDVGFDIVEYSALMSGMFRPVRHGPHTIFSGGHPTQWDGVRLTECGWHYYPAITWKTGVYAASTGHMSDYVAPETHGPLAAVPHSLTDDEHLAFVANDLWTKYEAHRIKTSGPCHYNVDIINVLTPYGDVTDLPAALSKLNGIAATYSNHLNSFGIGYAHGSADSTNIITATHPAYDTATGLLLATDLRTQYIGHIAKTTGAPLGCHQNADTANTPATIPASILGDAQPWLFSYVAVYTWVDAVGARHWSTPSEPSEFSLLAGYNACDVDVTCLTLTEREDKDDDLYPVQIEIFRSLHNSGTAVNSPYYYVGSVANDRHSATVTFRDLRSDATIASHRQVYTRGGVMPSGCPTAARTLTIHDGRVWSIPADDPTQVVFSHATLPGEAPRFPDGFAMFSANGQAYTALGSVGDKLFAWQSVGIDAIMGNGPNDTGSGQSYTDPHRVCSVVGAIDHRGIVRHPTGWLFLAESGLWSIDEGYQTKYVASVDDYLEALPTVVSCINDEANRRILMLCNDAEEPTVGSVLAWHYDWDLWSSWSMRAYDVSIVTLANDLRTQYNAHIVLVGAGPCHLHSDAVYAATAPVATDPQSALTLIRDIRLKYISHRLYVNPGAGQVHLVSDPAHALVEPYPLDIPMACATANEIKTALAGHMASLVVHSTADVAHTITAADASIGDAYTPCAAAYIGNNHDDGGRSVYLVGALDGRVYRERNSGEHIDPDGTWITLSGMTGWISAAGLQAAAHGWRVGLLSSYIDPFKLTLTIHYDYSDEATHHTSTHAFTETQVAALVSGGTRAQFQVDTNRTDMQSVQIAFSLSPGTATGHSAVHGSMARLEAITIEASPSTGGLKELSAAEKG